jgi:hypothetical protein
MISKYSKLSNKKKYFVYFEDGIKVYNLENRNLESINKIDIKINNVFYYFSNNNITGVDAKQIMFPDSHGLVTVSNSTLLRDFSQGIFRMRNILNGNQTIDIVIDRLMTNEDKILSGGTGKLLICEQFESKNFSADNKRRKA